MLRARFLLAPVVLGAELFSRSQKSAHCQPVDPFPSFSPVRDTGFFATQAAKAWVVAC
ncbi:hypothetical protein HRbin09_01024 [bacterium HR09]|nr:hypothetical protein HRbin09_01024 [bacterium HR09]